MNWKCRAVVGWAVLWSSGAMANLLMNPGFEMGDFTGWTRFTEFQDWRVTDWPADLHSGNYAVVNDVLASGGDEWRGIYQLVPVEEGLSYDYTAYQRAANVESGISESFLELQWLNSGGGVISQWQSTHVVADQDWTLMGSNNLVAPMGAVTASVRAIVHVMGTPVDTDWHVYDDFSFAQTIPEPGTTAFLGMGLAVLLVKFRRR